jgi:hypothetical protein
MASNYLQELEKELTARLDYAKECVFEQKDWESWTADFIAFVREEVLKSFKNGREAAQNRGNRKSGKTGQPPRNLPTSQTKTRE